MSEAARVDRPSEVLLDRLVVMLLAKVISRPSSTQATPSDATTRVWNRDHGNRSIRAGIRVLIDPDCDGDFSSVEDDKPGSLPIDAPACAVPGSTYPRPNRSQTMVERDHPDVVRTPVGVEDAVGAVDVAGADDGVDELVGAAEVAGAVELAGADGLLGAEDVAGADVVGLVGVLVVGVGLGFGTGAT